MAAVAVFSGSVSLFANEAAQRAVPYKWKASPQSLVGGNGALASPLTSRLPFRQNSLPGWCSRSRATGIVRIQASSEATQTKAGQGQQGHGHGHGHGHGGKKYDGFIGDMWKVAIKLHSKDQAKDGEKPAQKPVQAWSPTKELFLQFLVDSKVVFETLEKTMQTSTNPLYADFRKTGLERTEALSKDIKWFADQGFAIPEPGEPGKVYAAYLADLAKNDPPSFICHFYNVYFAHTAGGRMIGAKISNLLFGDRVFEFYKWDADVTQLSDPVRTSINRVASSWTEEEKNRCLEETEASFKYSGSLLHILSG